MMRPYDYDRLIEAEFQLETMEEGLEEGDPDKADLRRALSAIDRVARRARGQLPGPASEGQETVMRRAFGLQS